MTIDCPADHDVPEDVPEWPARASLGADVPRWRGAGFQLERWGPRNRTASRSHRPAASGRSEWAGTSRYEILRPIGRGGMGVVYEALDRERQQLVALKTLLHSSPAALYLFKQEFRTLADVHHPNLVQLYELVVAETDRAFFTMELVRGTDFLTHVRAPRASAAPGAAPARRGRARAPPRGQAAPRHQAVERARDARGARRAPRLRRRHRARRPRRGEARRRSRGDGGHRALHGARAPAAQPPTAASDWYSVGVMLYEALARTRPAGARRAAAETSSRRDPAPAAPTAQEIARSPGRAPRLDRGAPARRRPGRDGPFVGREAPLQALRDAFDAVARRARRSPCAWRARRAWASRRWCSTSSTTSLRAARRSSCAAARTSASRSRTRRSTAWSTRSAAT